MKKSILRLKRLSKPFMAMLLLSMTCNVWANPIDLQTAREVGMKFVNANAEVSLRSMDDLQLASTYRTSKGIVAFYIFNTLSNFVIVSADDCATPILGYSDVGRFDERNIPIQMQAYLQGFVEQIEYGIRNHFEPDANIAQQWETVRAEGRLNNDRNSEAVEPMVAALWDQGCYYNAMCPEDANGQCGHVPTGCVATAMGMIMHYWGYPLQGIGSHSYTPNGYPEQSVNFGTSTYNWANMPNQLTASSTQAEIDEVATLLWHCGVAVDMAYGAAESGATDGPIPTALMNYFGYASGAYYMQKDDASEWMEHVKTYLDLGRPIMYFATDAGGLGGHTFVCDGYNASDLLHFNWGWGGNGNGYFAVDALNVGAYQLNQNVHALFGILPPTEFTLQYNIVEGGAEVARESSSHNYCNIPAALTIPSSVTIDGTSYPIIAIGESAFRGCTGLQCVTMPNTITTVKENAFNSCGSLSQVDFSTSLIIIKENAFLGTSLTTADLPEGLTTIKTQAFSWCNNLSSITIPRSVTSISGWAFNFGSLEGEITINYNAENCVVEQLSQGAIYPVFTRGTEINIGEHVETIPTGLFMSCSGNAEVSIPNSVTTIERHAFSGSGIAYVSIGENVTSIGEYAFYECNGLSSITIPENVSAIGIDAFSKCSNLSTVNFNAKNCSAPLIFGECGNLETINFGNSVQIIPAQICRDVYPSSSSNLTNVNFGNSIETIGNMAFIGCSNITSLVLPTSLKNINGGAFENCTGLTSLSIPDNIAVSIGESTGQAPFGGCSHLETLTIGRNVEYIAPGAFRNCTALQNVNYLVDSIPIIDYSEESPFNGCSNLNTVSFGSNVRYIPPCLCYGLGSLSGTLVIPNSVTTIGDEAFFECTGLTTVSFGNNVKTIGASTFYGCTGLSGNLALPNSLKRIESYAFGDCTGLTGRLVLPSSLTYVEYGFAYCSGFSSVMAMGTTPPEAVDPFQGTSYPIYVPFNPEDIYNTEWRQFGSSRIRNWMQKTVAGYGSGNDKWTFIASPIVGNTNPEDIEGLMATIPEQYDLYRFNQAGTNGEWQNYKAHTDDFTITNGHGYLYANKNSTALLFLGSLDINGWKYVDLSYEEETNLAGWNLVGNPFPTNAYLDRSYYVMNSTGTGVNPTAKSKSTAISVFTGVLVKAATTGEKVYFTNEPQRNNDNDQGCIEITVAERIVSRYSVSIDSTTMDKAIVSFNQGDELGKFVFNKDNAKLYILQNGEDYAIAFAEKQGEMPLNFKASQDGQYTISINPENVEMNYLHLIDNITGADIDLLAPELVEGPASYTFTAKTTDYESRFRLVFSANGISTGSATEETFAYYADGEIIIMADMCDASLQVIDLMGRVVYQGDAMNRVSTGGMVPGVYVLRLINGDDVRVQKIVVR